MTDTTIQEKEHSDKFERLRRLLDNSPSLDDFIEEVNEGILMRSHGVSGLTASGVRSLTEWYNYRKNERFIEVPVRGTMSEIYIRRTFVRIGSYRYVRYRNIRTGKFVSLESGRKFYALRKRVMA